MSRTITNIDLTAAIVGTKGTIKFPTQTNIEGYTLLLFNESGCGLHILFIDSLFTDKIPAGGWRRFDLEPGEEGMNYTVDYLIAGAKVSLLIGTLYEPFEEVPSVGTLGNSPVGT